MDREDEADSFAGKEQVVTPGIYAMPQEVLTLLLDQQMAIERLRHDLAGEILEVYKDENGMITTRWLEKGERKMNNHGIRFVTSVLSEYLSPSSATSDLEDDEIYMITREVAKFINGILYSKGKEFEVDPNYKTWILKSITHMIFIELKKSHNAMFIKALTQAYQVKELKGYDKKKGITDVLLSPFKGKEEK